MIFGLFTELCNYQLSILFLFGHVAYGTLVPGPGIKPVPPSFRVWSLNHWTAKEVPHYLSVYALLLCCMCLSKIL